MPNGRSAQNLVPLERLTPTRLHRRPATVPGQQSRQHSTCVSQLEAFSAIRFAAPPVRAGCFVAALDRSRAPIGRRVGDPALCPAANRHGPDWHRDNRYNAPAKGGEYAAQNVPAGHVVGARQRGSPQRMRYPQRRQRRWRRQSGSWLIFKAVMKVESVGPDSIPSGFFPVFGSVTDSLNHIRSAAAHSQRSSWGNRPSEIRLQESGPAWQTRQAACTRQPLSVVAAPLAILPAVP